MWGSVIRSWRCMIAMESHFRGQILLHGGMCFDPPSTFKIISAQGSKFWLACSLPSVTRKLNEVGAISTALDSYSKMRYLTLPKVYKIHSPYSPVWKVWHFLTRSWVCTKKFESVQCATLSKYALQVCTSWELSNEKCSEVFLTIGKFLVLHQGLPKF